MSVISARLVTAALAAVLALAGLRAAAADPAQPFCLTSDTPPPPPAGGAVLWSPLKPGSSEANTVVVPGDTDNEGVFQDGVPVECAHATVQQPQVISVAKGKALFFVSYVYSDPSHTTSSESHAIWGAVNVSPSDPPPVIKPDSSVPWALIDRVGLSPAAYAASAFRSCRGCDLSGQTDLVLEGALGSPPPWYAPAGDFTGASFRGSRVTGVARRYNFTGADLSGASFNMPGDHFGLPLLDATFDNTTVDGIVFSGSDLQGAKLSSLRFKIPPSFAGATLGGPPGTTCTSIADTNLLDVSFAGATWVLGCSGQLFPGSPIPAGLVREILAAGGGAVALKDALAGAQIVASLADWRSLAGADFSGVNLAGATFLGVPVDLTGARFDGATLTGIDFGLARLAGATFENVNAAGASFTGADLSGDGIRSGASFAGPTTNLQEANFVNANLSGASFQSADLTGAVFTGARGIDTDFNSVRAPNAVFSRVHLYGNGEAFDNANDLRNADFSGAVLAADATIGGGFDFTRANLTNARFDGTVCVACNFTGATLKGASFTGAYLPGVILGGATLMNVSFDQAWLYCGNLANSSCTLVPKHSQTWEWPLLLGSGEVFGPVPFRSTNLTGVSLASVTACPDGSSGSALTGCQGHLLPDATDAPPIPAPCSPSAGGACPTKTSMLFDASTVGAPLAVVAIAPPTWNTKLSGQGYFASFDDGTIRLVGGEEPAAIVAGTPGTGCPAATAPCGDGGPATSALLGTPTGLAVGLDGSLYIADSGLRRVRRIDPLGVITTVAGTGARCDDPPCGDSGPATKASLTAANGIWVDPHGVLLIADGTAGVRRVAADGLIATEASGGSTGDVQAVTAIPTDTTGVGGPVGGAIYASTPDAIIRIDYMTGVVTRVVGVCTPARICTSGYNGNTDSAGFLLPGTQVQVNRPIGLSVNRDGNVVFADSGNHLIRAYVPSSGHVIDDLAGLVAGGIPQGGFNDDGHWAAETKLSGPRAVAATRSALLVVADTGNQRIRQVGPGPASSVGSARSPDLGALWVGLKNSDAVGLRLDLFAQVSVGGQEVARGQLDNVSAGGSGFNNARLSTIPLRFVPPYLPPVALPDVGELQITLKARRTCSGGGHASGIARLWFDDAQAASRFALTIDGVTKSFYLRAGAPLPLGVSPGTGPKKTIDVVLNSTVPCAARRGRPFVPFGTWRITLPE